MILFIEIYFLTSDSCLEIGSWFLVLPLFNVRHRIDVFAVQAHLKVQVRAGRVSGRTHERDRFAAVNLLPHRYESGRSMAVARHYSVAMVNINVISVTGVA